MEVKEEALTGYLESFSSGVFERYPKNKADFAGLPTFCPSLRKSMPFVGVSKLKSFYMRAVAVYSARKRSPYMSSAPCKGR